jgi:hemerythrin-like domain-containing protein
MGRGHDDRREFLVLAGALGAGALLTGCASAATPGPGAGSKEGEEVSPAEDLMREHGVLRRVLFIYDEITHRLGAAEPFPLEVLTAAAGIVRRFVEDYHEKQEEDFVFPRFEEAHQMVKLVTVLRQQHQAGRRLTDAILAMATPASLAGAAGRAHLAAVLQAFARMYRAHAAREDTVLFPALRPLMGARAYDALGELFEDREHAIFGPRGFEGIVAGVAQLEDAIGLGDLAQFTVG